MMNTGNVDGIIAIKAATKIEYLNKMKEMLSKPGAWIQREYAASDNPDENVVPGDPRANHFCLSGCLKHLTIEAKALEIAIRHDLQEAIMETTEFGDTIYPTRAIIAYNDKPERTQDDVVKMIDYTIEMIQRSTPT